MNLILDIGNTNIKIAVYDSVLVELNRVQIDDIYKHVDIFIKKYDSIRNIIISSVIYFELTNFQDKYKNFNIHVLNENSNLPFKNLYQSKISLGSDRIALVSSAAVIYPNKNVLVIDAGTCITYDFLSKKSHYLGGSISPGIRMRYKSLNQNTSKLPMLKTTIPKKFISINTNQSIHAGVINGVLHEIRGQISEYEEEYANLTVILTGGDAKFLSNQLKISIFANQNFLLDGLNHLIKLNLSN